MTNLDSELIKNIAEKVMGWKLWTNPCHDDRYSVDGSTIRERLPNGTDRLWCPLTQWNPCMEVVDAMGMKGYRFNMATHGLMGNDYAVTVSFYIQDQERTLVECTLLNDPRRAVLIAALGALTKEEK